MCIQHSLNIIYTLAHLQTQANAHTHVNTHTCTYVFLYSFIHLYTSLGMHTHTEHYVTETHNNPKSRMTWHETALDILWNLNSWHVAGLKWNLLQQVLHSASNTWVTFKIYKLRMWGCKAFSRISICPVCQSVPKPLFSVCPNFALCLLFPRWEIIHAFLLFPFLLTLLRCEFTTKT